MAKSKAYDFEVKVSTEFLEEQSHREKGPYVFAYTIQIVNKGLRSAQLLRRHWLIKDAFNIVHEVKGDGVVGEQPHIKPGQLFEYSSGCPLPSPVGTMKGSYTFKGDDGSEFEVPVAEFVLSMPRVLH